MTDVLGILWSPVRFIKKRCKGEIALVMPFVIFLGALVLFVVDMLIMYQKIIGTIEGHSNLSMANLGFTLNLVFFAINMFLFWVVGSGILTCLAILLDGEGEYRRVLELTGLAHLPSLIFAVVGLGIALMYQPALRLRLPEPGAKMTVAEMKDFESDLRKDINAETRRSSFRLIHTCRYIFTAWTLLLCVIAVKYSFGLDYTKSGMSVAGLVLLYVALEVARAKIMAGN